MFSFSRIGILAAVFLVQNFVQAFPLPNKNFDYKKIPKSFTQNYHFEGIVSLSNCSGSIIRFENSATTDSAYILTNGHCLEFGMPGPGRVISHESSYRTFGVLNDKSETIGQLHATEIVYSTMTHTDMTLYKVRESYQEIFNKFKVRPFLLQSVHPKIGTNIQVISGYWKRGYTCSIENFVQELKEDAWTMKDSIRYSRPGCEIIGGTSGSPIIEFGTRNVIGINNTINEDGERCTMNNPCEKDSEGNIQAQQGVGYGQETYWVYTCLNSSNQLDLNLSGCLLPH